MNNPPPQRCIQTTPPPSLSPGASTLGVQSAPVPEHPTNLFQHPAFPRSWEGNPPRRLRHVRSGQQSSPNDHEETTKPRNGSLGPAPTPRFRVHRSRLYLVPLPRSGGPHRSETWKAGRGAVMDLALRAAGCWQGRGRAEDV